MAANLGFFLGHMLLETVDRYTPDVARPRTLPVTVTVGEGSVGEPVAMPGNHFGIQTRPVEFAAGLRTILSGR